MVGKAHPTQAVISTPRRRVKHLNARVAVHKGKPLTGSASGPTLRGMIHRILPAALMALLLLSGVSTTTHAQPAAALRPPAVPLVTHDPYFSVWSFSDHLNTDWPKHWTGAINGMTAILRVDGKGYTLMGNPRVEGLTAMTQRSVEVLPTRTIYQFEGAGVGVTLTFLTPALPMDLDVLSRPLTYVDFKTKA